MTRFKNTLVTGAHGLVGSTIPAKYRPTSKELNLMDIDSIIKYLNSNNVDRLYIVPLRSAESEQILIMPASSFTATL